MRASLNNTAATKELNAWALSRLVKILTVIFTDAGVDLVKVISFQDKRKRRIEENLSLFQVNFWEWVFAYRWRPCYQCICMLQSCWREERLWSGLCSVCRSDYYYYQVLYVRALKAVCRRGEKNPTFRELDEWYLLQEKPIGREQP